MSEQKEVSKKIHALIDERYADKDVKESKPHGEYQLTTTLEEWAVGNMLFVDGHLDEILESESGRRYRFNMVCNTIGHMFIQYLIGEDLMNELIKEVRKDDER